MQGPPVPWYRAFGRAAFIGAVLLLPAHSHFPQRPTGRLIRGHLRPRFGKGFQQRDPGFAAGALTGCGLGRDCASTLHRRRKGRLCAPNDERPGELNGSTPSPSLSPRSRKTLAISFGRGAPELRRPVMTKSRAHPFIGLKLLVRRHYRRRIAAADRGPLSQAARWPVNSRTLALPIRRRTRAA